MYQLIYWALLPGRGEFVRLVLEDAGVEYEDLARGLDQKAGVELVYGHLHGGGESAPGFAPPFLIDGDLKLAQTPVVCAYLGERHGLAPDDPAGRLRALQLAVTVADVVEAVHQTHHPVRVNEAYETQKPEAAAAAAGFRGKRLGTWLAFFERCIEQSGGPFLLGDQACHADLALFQLVEGLRYAFPNSMMRHEPNVPGVAGLVTRVAERPRLAAYLASERRMAFSEVGIFRRYPELDPAE